MNDKQFKELENFRVKFKDFCEKEGITLPIVNIEENDILGSIIEIEHSNNLIASYLDKVK